jgi:hypothetical protein
VFWLAVEPQVGGDFGCGFGVFHPGGLPACVRGEFGSEQVSGEAGCGFVEEGVVVFVHGLHGEEELAVEAEVFHEAVEAFDFRDVGREEVEDIDVEGNAPGREKSEEGDAEDEESLGGFIHELAGGMLAQNRAWARAAGGLHFFGTTKSWGLALCSQKDFNKGFVIL